MVSEVWPSYGKGETMNLTELKKEMVRLKDRVSHLETRVGVKLNYGPYGEPPRPYDLSRLEGLRHARHQH